MKTKIEKFHIIVLVVLIGMNLNILAQNKPIALWDEKIPGEILSVSYEEKEIYSENELQSTSKVKIPTLTIYSPNEISANGTSVLLFPGGGYSHLSMNKEGKKIAKWLNSLGITAFVLKYRMPSDEIMKDKSIGPLQDAQEAVRMVRRNAKKWNLDTNKIGVIGFSAGGHLAATLSTRHEEKTYESTDNTSSKPNFTLLVYSVISMHTAITNKGSRDQLLGLNPSQELINKFSSELHVNSTTPPTFIVHASDDKSVPVENSINYYLALKNMKIQAEMHIYEKGGHGFGLGTKETSKNWTNDCENWLKSNNYIP